METFAVTRPRPVFLRWTGEVFVPEPSFKHHCDQYMVGSIYPMVPQEQRSWKSHRHYFAAIAEGYHNLSEENAKHFPTPEHLRHWCLVHCGHCTQTDFVLSDEKEARKTAADIRKRSPYAVISRKGNVVMVWDAISQSEGMEEGLFEQTKRDVLDLIASMARTTHTQLSREARHHGR